MGARPHDVLNQEMKTVRFSQVVAKCGKPVVHDQWLALEQDSALKKAVKESRLMTVHIQTVGSTKDYGEVGLVKKGQHMLLVFSKSLAAFEGRRVVGIDYDLLKETAVRTAKKAKPTKEKSEPAAKSKAADSEAALRLFRPDEEVDRKAPPKKKAKARAAKTPPKESKASSSADAAALRRQIKLAMKQLQSGKAVMAYHTLENSLK